MKTLFRFLLLFTLVPLTALAQGRAQEFQITKITKNLITTPQIGFSGGQQYQTNQRESWLEVEVTFASAPEVADDVTLKYFILINGKLLTGDVTHNNVIAGKEHRSVMYVPPRVLVRFNDNKAVTSVSIQNIAVQILQQGGLKDEASLTRAPANWYSTIPAINGFVYNKDQTPFAALYWDRYELIKPPAAK